MLTHWQFVFLVVLICNIGVGVYSSSIRIIDPKIDRWTRVVVCWLAIATDIGFAWLAATYWP